MQRLEGSWEFFLNKELLKLKSRPKLVHRPSSEICILFSLLDHRKPFEIYEEMLRSKAGKIETAGVTMTLLSDLYLP